MAPKVDQPTLTPQQREAIYLRGVSIALSAGAGCGKTFVLTSRFLSHLDGPDAAPLRQLTAITFTERAAREMRKRIGIELRKKLRESSGADAAFWLSQLRSLHTARVSTIHSFCQSLLRVHAVEAGLDPNFRVLDEVEAGAMLLSTVEDELERQLADHAPPVMRLAVVFGMSRLRTLILQMVRSRQQIWFGDWIGRTPDQLVASWRQIHHDSIVPDALRQFLASDCVADLLHTLRMYIPANTKMRERRAVLLDLLPGLLESRDLAGDLDQLLENARVQGAGTAKAWDDPDAYEAIKQGCNDLRDQVKELRELVCWDGSGAEQAAASGLDLLNLCVDVRDRYRQRKLRQAVLDFDDLLVFGLELLTDPRNRALRRDIAQRTTLLLVDEFQDTDEIQERLIRALCDDQVCGGKLFIVGDAKQSIYRFRGAEPYVFRALQSELPREGRLPLHVNFRSQPAIIRFVNALFCDEMADYEPLAARRAQATDERCIDLICAYSDETGETVETMRRREADWIARRLKQLLAAQTPVVCEKQEDRFEPRPLKPGDIAILFRALSNVECYEQALRQHGIDYYLVGGHAFYSQQEVFDLINLLRSIAFRADEVSLLAVLRSPFFCISDEALYWLAQVPAGLTSGFYSNTIPPPIDAQQRQRIVAARQTLLALRARKDRLSISQLINEALERTGYDAVLIAEFLGERKLANLRKLIDMARRFESSGLLTLGDFITQLTEFVSKQPREALAATQSETGDVVRMMSIHQAKGLEFKLVVVPDLDRAHQPRSSEGVAFDRRLGPLVKLPKGSPGSESICGFDLFCQQEATEDAAEITRLLYVALTRAEDYLILSTSMKNAPSAPWTRLLASRFDLTTGELRCELPTEYERPAPINVITSKPELQGEAPSRPDRRDLLAVVKAARNKPPRRPSLRIDPVPPATAAKRRYSFSRLSGQLQGEDAADIVERPDPVAGVDPLRLGTIVHAVLAEFHPASTIDVIQRVRHHAAIFLREEPVLVAEACRLVERFLQSDRARLLRKARQLHTELEFLLSWPPGDASSSCYLHGFIDCLYQDASGGWHILDYKTNRVTSADVPGAARQYEMQMFVYALAAEQVLRQLPDRLILHFLHPGLDYDIHLDAPARKRALDLVDRAISVANNGQEAVVS